MSWQKTDTEEELPQKETHEEGIRTRKRVGHDAEELRWHGSPEWERKQLLLKESQAVLCSGQAHNPSESQIQFGLL